MTTERNIITTIVVAAALVSMTGIIGAYTEVTSNPDKQAIPIGGTGTYTISVNTDVTGVHTIKFRTESGMLASLTGNGVNTGGFAQSGKDAWNAPSTGVYTFAYTVQPQSGATLGDTYTSMVEDWGAGELGWARPRVVVSTTPIPELPGIALAGIGAMVGLIALGRRKD